MRIGVVKEIKDLENRVALTPDGAKQLIADGHELVLEQNAGAGSGFDDDQYRQLGVQIVSASEAWNSDLVIKIKEPMESEYAYLKDNILFTYLHLAGVTPTLTEALLQANTTAIAYETIEDAGGALPLLAPMSAVAGNMAASIGSYYLARFNGGKGVQLGSVLGKRQGQVMVIGAGIAGQHAALTAAGMGANVSLFGRIRAKYDGNPELAARGVKYIESTAQSIGDHIAGMDLVVGAALLVGARAPSIVSTAMVQTMEPGSVIVDISIDQGGCIETSRPTSHSQPVFVEHGVTHYCVTNMPGAFPRTATLALTSRTLPYARKIGSDGLDAIRSDAGFVSGVNTHQGKITYRSVAEALERTADYQPFT